MSIEEREAFLSNFTQHKCHKTIQDVSTRGSSSAEQLTKTRGSKRSELFYDIHVV